VRTLHGVEAPLPWNDDDAVPGTSAWSPSYEEDGPAENPMLPPLLVNHRASPNEEQGDWSAPRTIDGGLLPPSPSVGGQTGRTNQLGWTQGLRSYRHIRQFFTGATMVVPSMGAHPAVGPVGFTTRSQRLANGVQDLYSTYLPAPSVIAQSFLTPTSADYQAGGDGVNGG
jgi:hypothetical protein